MVVASPDLVTATLSRDRDGREAHEEHLRMIIEAATNNIQLIREAFAISLYHAWERFAVSVERSNKPWDGPEGTLSKEEVTVALAF